MQGDEIIFGVAILLTAFGIVMVYSASYFIADYQVFLKQVTLSVFGLFALILGMFVNPEIWKRFIKIGLIVLAAMMIFQLYTPLGPRIHGTKRWFDLGFFNLQTSEIARCMLIIFLARYLSTNPYIGKSLTKKLGLLIAVPVTFCGLIILQPDFSSMMMVFLIVCIVLFLGGVRKRYFVGAALTTIPLLMLTLRDYQKDRILSFFMPDSEDKLWNYQQYQSLIGLVRGGLEGKALGQGYQAMRFLPEAHNDFIFGIIGEELGFLGTSAVLIAFMVIFYRGIMICYAQPDRYGFLLGAGLIGSLTLYALTNIGVAIGLLPVTGLPLPFISAGGSSLVISLWSIGVLWRLSRRVV